MDPAYRDSSDSLRARVAALEIENAALQGRIRKLVSRHDARARREITGWLSGALMIVIVLALVTSVLGSCVAMIAAPMAGIQ